MDGFLARIFGWRPSRTTWWQLAAATGATCIILTLLLFFQQGPGQKKGQELAAAPSGESGPEKNDPDAPSTEDEGPLLGADDDEDPFGKLRKPGHTRPQPIPARRRPAAEPEEVAEEDYPLEPASTEPDAGPTLSATDNGRRIASDDDGAFGANRGRTGSQSEPVFEAAETSATFEDGALEPEPEPESRDVAFAEPESRPAARSGRPGFGGDDEHFSSPQSSPESDTEEYHARSEEQEPVAEERVESRADDEEPFRRSVTPRRPLLGDDDDDRRAADPGDAPPFAADESWTRKEEPILQPVQGSNSAASQIVVKAAGMQTAPVIDPEDSEEFSQPKRVGEGPDEREEAPAEEPAVKPAPVAEPRDPMDDFPSRRPETRPNPMDDPPSRRSAPRPNPMDDVPLDEQPIRRPEPRRNPLGDDDDRKPEPAPARTEEFPVRRPRPAPTPLKTRVPVANGPVAKLRIEMRGPRQVAVGEPVVLDFRISNIGDAPATGVMAADLLPPELRHPRSPDLVYRIGTLQPGESRSTRLRLTAARAGRTINRATVEADGNVTAETSWQIDVVSGREASRQLTPTASRPQDCCIPVPRVSSAEDCCGTATRW